MSFESEWEANENLRTCVAVQVRSVDYPQFVAWSVDEILDAEVVCWDGEQCDNCGNTHYFIKRDSKFKPANIRKNQFAGAFYAECVPDEEEQREWYGDDIPEGIGCHTQYRLFETRRGNVQ